MIQYGYMFLNSLYSTAPERYPLEITFYLAENLMNKGCYNKDGLHQVQLHLHGFSRSVFKVCRLQFG